MKRTRAVWISLVVSTSLCAVACDSKGGGDSDTKSDKESDADDSEKSKKKKDKKKKDKKGKDDSEKKSDKKSDKSNPKEGDSCKGISATDGLINCDGNKVIFCSSYSDYKWKKQSECKDGTKCVAEGKAASCK